MALLELRHVQSDHVVLMAEQELRHSAHQLGLAHAGGSQEQEHADGMARVLEAGPGAAHGLGNAYDSFVLADDALVQFLFHAEQPLGFFLRQPRHRDAGPHADHFGDIILGDLRAFLAPVRLPLCLHVADVLGQVELAVAQLGGDFVLLRSDGLVLLLAHALQDFHRVLDFLRGVAAAQAHPRAGFVQQVDGLVGQEAVGDVPG